MAPPSLVDTNVSEQPVVSIFRVAEPFGGSLRTDGRMNSRKVDEEESYGKKKRHFISGAGGENEHHFLRKYPDFALSSLPINVA